MKVIKKTGNNDIATVFVAKNEAGKLVEFVESVQPPIPLTEKWVVIISTLFGCPVDCKFCDAGGNYSGRLSADELLFQVDHLIGYRFGPGKISTKKFKIQFSRMGEPSFNPAVLEVLRLLPEKYNVPELIPSLSTVGPVGAEKFFSELAGIKRELYQDTFQLQFSLHSTDEGQRDSLIPFKKMGFQALADYGRDFFGSAGKKITLNFALTDRTILETPVLLHYFDPAIFLVKITPMNPTYKADINNFQSLLTKDNSHHPVIDELSSAGYEVIKSIGEWEENKIGSNCGQYVNTLTRRCNKLENSYTAFLENL
jgi:23S rRNA (adenine2503-C2)-methyltransferase